MALRPLASQIPLINDTVPFTGTVLDQDHIEEGNSEAEDEFCAYSDSQDSSFPLELAEAQLEPEPDPLSILVQSENLRQSNRVHKANPKYIPMSKAVVCTNVCSNICLANICPNEANKRMIPYTEDSNSWKPTSRSA